MHSLVGFVISTWKIKTVFSLPQPSIFAQSSEQLLDLFHRGMSFYTHAVFTGQLHWYFLTILFAFPWLQSSSTCSANSKKFEWWLISFIQKTMNALTCFLKDSLSKLLWRLCGMFGECRHCTQVERLSSQKNVEAYQQHINILDWKHQKKLSLLLSNSLPPEEDWFCQKSQLSPHFPDSCHQFMMKQWSVFWQLFMNIEYQFKLSNAQTEL